MPESSSQFIKRGYRDYAMYVIMNRHIPYVGDGLKVSQRIALYLIANRAEKIRSISLAGDMLKSELYVHGESAASDVISLLASPYLNNIPLLKPESDGGFGSIINPTADAISQPRYTFVRRSKVAQDVLYVDEAVCPIFSNYSGKTMPRTFLPLIPTVLLNGVSGICPGYKIDILPRDFDDLVKAVVRVLDGESPGKLTPTVMGRNITFKIAPDKVNEEGDRKWIATGAFYREGNRIYVTDLPPDLTLEAFKMKLDELELEGKIKDSIDHSADTIKVEIVMSRNDLATMDDEAIISMLEIRSQIIERMFVVSWDQNRIDCYKDAGKIVEDFVKWRLGFYEARYKKLLEDEIANEHYLRSVLACFSDSVPKKAQGVKDKALLAELANTAIRKAKLEPKTDDVERIVGIPLYRWTEEGEQAAKDALAESRRLITEYTAILKSPKRRREIYREEVSRLRAKDYR